MQPIIEFRNISKSFKDKIIFKNLNFSIGKEEIVALVGKSGSGKTTLFNLFFSIYRPDSGSIFYYGKKVNSRIKQEVGFATQNNSFYPSLNVEENLSYFGSSYNLSLKDIKERTKILLELMELEGARKTKGADLSAGMKRRLDLAIALIHDPDILILDEPTAGLDVVLNENIWKLILKINNLGKTILVSSHNLDEVQKYCSAIAFISNNAIIESKELQKMKGNLEQLFRRLCYDQGA